MDDMTERLVKVEQRAGSNTHRIDALEKNQEALNQIATSVAVLANEQQNISIKVDTIDGKVDALEHKPAKRWDGVVDKIISVVVGAVVGVILAKIGQ